MENSPPSALDRIFVPYRLGLDNINSSESKKQMRISTAKVIVSIYRQNSEEASSQGQSLNKRKELYLSDKVEKG